MKRLALFVLVVVSSMAIAQTPTRVRGDHRARGRCPVGQVARRARSQDPPCLQRRRNDRENGQPGRAQGQVRRCDRDQQRREDDRRRGTRYPAAGEARPLPVGPATGVDHDERQPRRHRASERRQRDHAELSGRFAKVFVPPGTPIVAFDPGSRADLKPGEWIWTNARQEADGKIVAERLNVSKDGVKPPH